MKLYYGNPSGNSYKVQILLALLKVPHEVAMLDLKKGEHKAPAYLKISPRGQVPALEDGGVVLWDSSAILAYIARKHGSEKWFPSEPGAMAQVLQWMALAGNEIQFGLQYARRGLLMGRWTAGTLEQGQAMGRVALDAMEARLKDHPWLALDHTTIADVACFPYIETAPESKVPLEPYPAVMAWLDRCRTLPGWAKR
jgi:glutathione S-transferase